ncbi:hypothetical protein [Streptomyces globisporus]
MQAIRLMTAIAASALAVGNAADGNTIAAVCWTIAAVICLALFVLAEDGR